MQTPSHLILKSPASAFALAMTLSAPGVAWADCPFAVRAATAEEQKFHADTFAQFQRAAPPAPAGWTVKDSASNGALKEVCAKPGEKVLRASFNRSYNRSKEESNERQAEAMRKIAALLQENQAATRDGKPVDYKAFDAASKKLEAEAKRDSGAQFVLSTGVTNLSVEGFSPVPVPVGKGYQQVTTNQGVSRHDLVIVLNPSAPQASGQTVVRISGDPARVDALLKTATLR